MLNSRMPALIATLMLSLMVTLPAASADSGSAQGAGAPLTSQRIVAAGGVITEIIYALGRGGLIAGVDSTSQFPPEALKTKANIGYVRALSSEGILSLHPTSVIAIDGAGPPDVLKSIEAAGVDVHRVQEVPTREGIAAKINEVAALVSEEKKGRDLATATDAQFVKLDEIRPKIAKPKRALFILSIQNGRAMVGGRNTPADGILQLAGLQNSAAGIDGWKPMADEAVIASAPDVIIAMDHGPQTLTAESILATPAFAGTPAAKTKSVLIFNGEYLLSFGPHTPQAAHDLLVAAYPEVAKSGEVPRSQ